MAHIIERIRHPWTAGDKTDYWAGTCKEEDVFMAIENYTDYPFTATSFSSREQADGMVVALENNFHHKGQQPSPELQDTGTMNNSPLARATVKTLRVLSAQFSDFADRIEEHPHAIPDESILHWWEAMAYNLTATIKQIRLDMKG